MSEFSAIGPPVLVGSGGGGTGWGLGEVWRGSGRWENGRGFPSSWLGQAGDL